MSRIKRYCEHLRNRTRDHLNRELSHRPLCYGSPPTHPQPSPFTAPPEPFNPFSSIALRRPANLFQQKVPMGPLRQGESRAYKIESPNTHLTQTKCIQYAKMAILLPLNTVAKLLYLGHNNKIFWALLNASDKIIYL